MRPQRRLTGFALLCTAAACLLLDGRLLHAAASSTPLSVDPFDRAAVIAFYRSVYAAALAVRNDWTGSVAACDAGRTSEAYADATIQAVNYFRAMTRLPGVSRSAALDVKSQQAALMMTANRALSHSPPASWACYTTGGAEAAARSNLAAGFAGAAAVAGYMADPGVGNAAVGHRRWILYPPQLEMGTGSTSQYNVLWVGSGGPRPGWPEFVAWPNAGFVPYPVVFPRWSFSLNHGGAAGADFTRATVTMTDGAAAIPLKILPVRNGYGDNTLVWEPSGIVTAAGMADRTITVTISNVLVQGAARSFTYEVTIIDPHGAEMVTAGAAPAPPTDHAVSVSGSTVTLSWRPPAGGPAPSSYRIQIGRSPGQSDIASLPAGASTSFVAGGVPVGAYYTRVISVASNGVSSPPSNEAHFIVGGAGCAVPHAPAALDAHVAAGVVTLIWAPSSGAASYIVEAGSAPFLSDQYRGDVGSQTSLAARVGPGTYFVRVRAASGCGESPASREVTVRVP